MARKSKTVRKNSVTVPRRPQRVDASDPLRMLSVRRASPHGAYGWVRDLPDARDFQIRAPLARYPHGLPKSVDLRAECPPVYDQGQLGSCTGNGIAGVVEFTNESSASRNLRHRGSSSITTKG